MELTDYRTILAIVATLLATGSTVYTWLTYRSRVNAQDIKANAADITELRAQLLQQRDEIMQLVTSLDNRVTENAAKLDVVLENVNKFTKELVRVHDRVDDVSKTVHKIDGAMGGLGQSVRIITDHLLNDKKES